MKKYYILLVLASILNGFVFAADFTLRVKRNEQVVVTASSQTQTNNTNNFQFYNLPGGYTTVKVVDKWTGQVLFNNNVNIPADYKVYAELDQFGNMNIISSTPLYTNNNQVGTVTYNNQGNGHNHWNNGWNNQYHNVNNQYFNQFVQILKDESFDSNRLKTAKDYVSKTPMTAQQIAQIAATFTFDSYRLEWAKTAYTNCLDKGNYFLLKSSFTFTSYYNDLIDYTSKL